MSSEDKPVSKIDETKPVVWTAEDASRFLTSAIHEAQKPLAEALRQRPITSRALTMVIGVLVVAALAIALILSNQLEKTEKRAERFQAAREEILTEKVVLQAQAQALEERVNVIQSRHDDLYGQVADLKVSEERHRRTMSELARFKQHNDLLRDYITGLEEEKAALSSKLMQALSIQPDSETDLDALLESVDVALPVEAAETPEPAAGDEAIVDEAAPAEEAVPEATPDAPAEPEPVPEPEPAPVEPAATPISSETTETGGAMAPPVSEQVEAMPAPEPEPEIVPENDGDFESTSAQYGEQLAQEAPAPEEPVTETDKYAANDAEPIGEPMTDADVDAVAEEEEAVEVVEPEAEAQDVVFEDVTVGASEGPALEEAVVVE